VTFGTPAGLLVLLVVPATLAFAIAIRRRPSRDAVAFTNVDVLASVAGRQRSWRPWAPVALLLLALTLAAGALARPHVARPTQVDDATVLLLVDVSGSMRAEDVEPSRMDAARAAMRTFLDRLPARYRVGLVQFSATPEILERPTHRRELVRQSLAYLDPDAGTAIGDALATATAVVKRALAEDRTARAATGRPSAAIVLLSDGTQTNGRRPALQGAEVARKAHVPVYTVALGTDRGFVPGPANILLPVMPDKPLMERIAAVTGGKTFTAQTAQEISHVFARLSEHVGRENRSSEITSWFACAAAGALAAALLAGRRLAGGVD
jgi:Ca-activated chloride channel family protein